jgi:hypothetical protein
MENGQGVISVEALDEKGNYRNFLDLQTAVVGPKGEPQTVRLEQTGPGHYEAKFPTKEVGAYLLNLMEMKGGKSVGSQTVGASVNYSPEFTASEPNLNLLRRIAESGGGKVLDRALPATDNPFLHNRIKTHQPRDLWELLLKLAVILFVLDVAVRRIQLDREELMRATRTLQTFIFLWKGTPRTPEAEESLSALLARRDHVRSVRTAPSAEERPELFQPEQAGAPGEWAAKTTGETPRETPTVPTSPEAKPASPEEASTTTSRLLEAKRRAQRRKP